MSSGEIIRRGRIEVLVFNEANADILNLLNNTVLGTPGGLRYKLSDIESRIKLYHDIWFVCLYMSEKLLGTLALCKRNITIGTEKSDAWYIRYFAFYEAFQASGKKNKRKRSNGSTTIQNSLKAEIIGLFTEPAKLGIPGLTNHSVIYAFLELKNIRSVQLVNEAGFFPTRYFKVIPYSHFHPGNNPNVFKAGKTDMSKLQMAWNEEENKHNAWFSDFLFSEGHYFIYKKGEEIIAGVQAYPTEYAMKEMPGIKGWFFLKVLIHLPGFRKIFEMKRYRFLAFEGLFCRSGCEDILPVLFESVCAQLGYHAGMIGLDLDSPYLASLLSSKKMGWLGRLAGKETIGFFIQQKNAGERVMEEMQRKPVYISANDFI